MEPDAEAIAVRLLARREHSAAELRYKLLKRGVDAGDIEYALRNLATRGWQDDRRFAESFATARADRGYGPLRIRAELQQRGLSAQAARTAVDELDRDWHHLAIVALQKHFGDVVARDIVERARRSRFLQRRGFSSGQTAAAVSVARGGDATLSQ